MSRHQMTREEVARLELGRTQVRPWVARTMVAVFLMTATLPSVVQVMVAPRSHPPSAAKPADLGSQSTTELSAAGLSMAESLSGWGLRSVIKLATLIPSGRELHQFEDRLNETSWVTRTLGPWVNWVIKGVLRGGDEQAYFGRDGWLFYRPSVDSVTGPGFLTAKWQRHRLRSADSSLPLPQADPLKALINFHRQLAARGIALVVVPTPGKESVEPDKLTVRWGGGEGLAQNPSFEAFTSELTKAGIDVFDPTLVLLERKQRSGENVFLRTDTHWSAAAMEEVAVQLASHLRDKKLVASAPPVTWQVRHETNRSSGDLTAMLNLPKDQPFFPPEAVPVTRVLTATGQPLEPDPGSAVLLLGDSFCNIYSLGSMGWGESAGFAEHLSLELGQAIDRIVINAGGAASTRQELARELASGRDRLAGKRLVIYQFAARELAFGDWKLLDLPAVTSPNPDIGRTAESGIVRGRVAAIARLPRPGTVPYRDCLVAIHLTQLRWTGFGAGKPELLVYAMGMRDNRWLPIASVTVGTDLQLRLRDWSEVESRFGGLNRAELDDLDLLSLPTFWAEEVDR